MDLKRLLIQINSETVITAISVSFLLSFTLLFFSPATLYYTNIFEFDYSFSDIFPILIGLSIVFGLLFSSVLLLLKGKCHQILIIIVVCLGVLFYTQGNILVWNYGFLNGQEIDWNNYLLNGIFEILIWITVFLIAFLKPDKIYRSAIIISVFLIVIQSVGFLALAYFAPHEPEWKQYTLSNDQMYDFSKNQNVIIIILDSFQSDVFQEIINEDENIKKELLGFVYYRNSLGGYPATTYSIPLILTGQYYNYSMSFDRFIENSYMSSSLPKKMKESGYIVNIYDSPYLVFPNKNMISNSQKNTIDYPNFITSRLMKLTVFRHLPHFLKGLWYSQMVESASNDRNGDELVFYLANDDLNFLASLNNITNDGNNFPMFKVYHFTGAHPPFRINKDLQYEVLPYNRTGYIEQSKASLKITGAFLEKLKEMGYYDNSLIIIVGDHGIQENSYGLNISQLNRDVPLSLITNIRTSAGIPLVLVKPFNSNGSLTISDVPVSLSDIPKTVATELSLANDFPGKSIQTINNSENRNRTFYYYSTSPSLPPDECFHEYIITNFSWYGDSWQPTYKVYTTDGLKMQFPPDYQYGTTIKFGENKPSTFLAGGWSLPEEPWVRSQEKMAIIAFSADKPTSDMTLHIKTIPFIIDENSEKQRVIIYFNKHEIGNLSSSIQEQWNDNDFFIPQTYFKEKVQYISFYLPDAISPKSLGISNDPRDLSIGLASFNLTGRNNNDLMR